jgi:hypothetical protein
METPTAPRVTGQHLTDIDIAKILGLAKGLFPQRKIATLMKCSQKAVQHTLVTYVFETFQGKNLWHKYQRKTTKLEDRHIVCTLKEN